MPSFDISSEVDMVALKNAVDTASKQITNRYDFKGTAAKIELNEKDNLITLLGDSDFQLDQVKDILLPAMEKKEPDSSKRLDHQDVQKVGGNKVKQELKIKAGIDTAVSYTHLDVYKRQAQPLAKNGYGQYLLRLLKEGMPF